MSPQRQLSTDREQKDSPKIEKEIKPTNQSGVSVIIPAYNYAKFLPFAIESALNQTYSRVEIIVVDDGSTDETASVVKKYGERVRYIYQQNSGLSAARNTGIKSAIFPYVAFLDADDCWEAEMLERGMGIFSQLSEEYAIVGCRAKYIDSEGNLLPSNPSFANYSGEITAEDILLMTRFPPSSVVAKKAAFDECGLFDTSLRSSEDRDMWLRIASKYRVYLNSEPLVLIRKHTANMSSNPRRMKENMAKVIKKAWKNRSVSRWRLWIWAQALAIHRYQISLIYLGLGKKLNAILELLLSLCFYPLPIQSKNINSAVSFIRLRTLARAIIK